MKVFAAIALIGIYGVLFCFVSDLVLKIKTHPDDIKMLLTVYIASVTPLAKEIVSLIAKIKFDSTKKYLKKIFTKKKNRRLKLPDND